MRPPRFALYDVKYADDPAMFARAETLFRKGKVQNIREDGRGYSAIVQGTQKYEVGISDRHVDEGYCSCYIGEHDMLCKHMLALALAVLEKTSGLTEEEPLKNLKEVKQRVNEGMKKLQPYNGPSRIWFSYQRMLATGAGVIAETMAPLPATEENAKYCWELALRLCKKLATGGIDDSDGVVGGCVSSLVEQLGKYACADPKLLPQIRGYCNDNTGFGFEDDLRKLLKNRV